MKSSDKWMTVSAIMGFTGVALGAFGAHGLKSVIDPDMLKIFETGIQYQLIHSVVMLAVALSGDTKYLSSEKFFLTGIILFSFSLYIYSVTTIKVFAMITPVGGIFLLIGWIVLIIRSIKKE